VMVTVAVPAVAVLLAVSVNTLLVEVLLGLKEAVTPLGRPDAARLTLPANPPWGAKEIVVEPLVPCTSVRLPGVAESKKPWMGATPGQLLTKLVALMLPMPLAKSQPVEVPYAGANEVLEVESTPTAPEGR
jgi:hypothetical protein